MHIPEKGTVFGAMTVIERIADHVSPDGRKRPRVLVECWACRARRETFVHKLIEGRARSCQHCQAQRMRERDVDIDGELMLPFLGGVDADRCKCGDCNTQRVRGKRTEAKAG